MSVFMTLIKESEYAPAFKAALRSATGEELKDAIGCLEQQGGAEHKLCRLRAALRRLKRWKKTP